MDVSYKHLNEICKSVTGSTAKEVIDNLLILESKRHLAVSDISIKELSYEVGFDEPTNFVKYFKRHTQQSPAQFRKSLAVSNRFEIYHFLEKINLYLSSVLLYTFFDKFHRLTQILKVDHIFSRR